MKLPFIKYQGTGNDFIIIDNRKHHVDKLDVKKLCHPKFGIGADGLMLLQNKKDFDFEMVYYNSDGNISTMCGNGGRCIVDFAKHLNVFNGVEANFIAIDGPHSAIWDKDIVELQMKNVDQIEKSDNTYILNTGSPHYVSIIDDVSELDIIAHAHAIRYNERFIKEGINVNFVQILDNDHIVVRTYERGVENETLSCGTGVTASAIALSKHLNFKPGKYLIHIETPGGNLYVKYVLNEKNNIENVWLCGPATMVFVGEVEISE